MSETRTKATSTSHHTSTLPETRLAKIQTSASAKTHQEETDTILTHFTLTQLFQCSYTSLYCIVLHHKPKVKAVRHTPCIRSDSQVASQLKMAKGGMHNPISRNWAINSHYNFATYNF